jgi:two-component system response regulator AtoC
VMLCKDGVINKADLFLKPNVQFNPVLDKQLKDMTLEQVEKYLLERALQKTNGNVSKAARQLGLTRMAMRYRMEKYHL